MLFDLAEPVLYVLEGLFVVDGVGDDDAVDAFVVSGGDGLEAGLRGGLPLLAGRVPDVELDGVLFDVERLDFEVDADGWEE